MQQVERTVDGSLKNNVFKSEVNRDSYLPKQIHPIIRPHVRETSNRTSGETLLGCNSVR